MPVSIKLTPFAGMLILEYNTKQQSFQAQHDLTKLKNDGEYYVLNLKLNLLYRGVFKKIGRDKFGALNLANYSVTQNNNGFYFFGHNQFLLDDECNIRVNRASIKLCKAISLAGTSPGLPVPAIASYSFTPIHDKFMTFVDEVDPSRLDVLSMVIRRERENLEITDLNNSLLAASKTPDKLIIWESFRAICQRPDRLNNRQVQDKLLKLVTYYRSASQFAFEYELMTDIASTAQLGLLSSPIMPPAAAPAPVQEEKRGFSLRLALR